MTLEEIKAAVREGKFKPSEIYGQTELVNDPIVVDHVDEKTNNIKGYQIRKLSDAEAKVASLEEANKTLTDQVGVLSKTTLVVKGRDVFASILKDRKIDGDEKFTHYVNKVYDKGFVPTDEAALKADLNKFVDAKIDEYKDYFGEEVKVGAAPAGGGNGAGGNKGVGADNKGTSTGGGPDLMDPANNDLIPAF